MSILANYFRLSSFGAYLQSLSPHACPLTASFSIVYVETTSRTRDEEYEISAYLDSAFSTSQTTCLCPTFDLLHSQSALVLLSCLPLARTAFEDVLVNIFTHLLWSPVAHKPRIMWDSVTSHRIRKPVAWSHGHTLMLIVWYTAWHLGHGHAHRHALWTRHRRSMWVLDCPHTRQGHVATDRHGIGSVRLGWLTRHRRIRAILSSCYTDRWRIMSRRPLVANMLPMRHSRMLVRHFRIRRRCC